MHVAIVTMAYNERVNLPIWVRHYRRQCPDATLFVLDHGSDDGSTNGLAAVNLIPLPRTPFDDQTRVELVGDFQHALLRLYDRVIYTDCDEMLVADPRRHASLAAFLATTDADVIAPIGLNVHQLIGVEPAVDLAAPILGQRRFVRFASAMCKPSIARVPLTWVPGFHWCDKLTEYRPDLFQFHLKWMDMNASLARLRFTRGKMAWSDRALRNGWARRQRQSDEERIREEYEQPAAEVACRGPSPFVFDAELRRISDTMQFRDGIYQGDFFRSAMTEVPAAFFGMI